MTKQELIFHLKDRIAYTSGEQGEYEAKHGEWNAKYGDLHSIYSEMADWHKGRACAFAIALELVENMSEEV